MLQRRFATAASALVALALFSALPAASYAEPLAARRSRAGTLSAAELGRQAAFEAYYGLYVGGQKVGFMRASLVAGRTITSTFALEARLGGMGEERLVTMQEVRSYAGRSGELVEARFVQSSATGRVTVLGHRRGSQFVVATRAGGREHKQVLVVRETLQDCLAGFRLARGAFGRGPAQVGDRLTTEHLDLAGQTVTEANLEVKAVRQQLLGGVAGQVVEMETRYPALGLEEQSAFDGRGQQLTSRIGGLFEARLEVKELAMERGAVVDVLINSVVAVPEPLPAAPKATGLEVRFSGFGEQTVPTSNRQAVRSDGNETIVTLSRERPIGVEWTRARLQRQLSALGRPGSADRQQLGEAAAEAVLRALQPTAFIQSDAPAILQVAKKAAGRTESLAKVVEALIEAVRSRLKSEYVPAFSNALEALQAGRGDCTEHSVLFAALARAVGLPARVAVGMVYWPPGNGFGWHAWCEVWAGDRWIMVDPTWGQPAVDVTHIKLAEGEHSEQLRIAMLLGRLKVVRWRLL